MTHCFQPWVRLVSYLGGVAFNSAITHLAPFVAAMLHKWFVCATACVVYTCVCMYVGLCVVGSLNSRRGTRVTQFQIFLLLHCRYLRRRASSYPQRLTLWPHFSAHMWQQRHQLGSDACAFLLLFCQFIWLFMWAFCNRPHVIDIERREPES